MCSIAAASKAVLAVCASCDSAYHLGCVEPSLPRVPLNDWFCGDCAKVRFVREVLFEGVLERVRRFGAPLPPTPTRPEGAARYMGNDYIVSYYGDEIFDCLAFVGTSTSFGRFQLPHCRSDVDRVELRRRRRSV